MREAFPWASAMIGCPHDPVYHAEGDPWLHTCMVVDALKASDGFDDLPAARRERLILSAWFHDVAKPMTTRIEWDEEQQRGRVRQPGHAPLGAKIAWQALVDAGYGIEAARDVHAMVFWHQRPVHMMDQRNLLHRVIGFGHETHALCWDDLLRLCKADHAGRICTLPADEIDPLDLLRLQIEDESANAGVDLLREPWPFVSAAARRTYLAGSRDASAFYAPQEPAGSRLVLMSGLPGSGKDTLIATHFSGIPVISLDDIRQEMGIDAKGNQGHVLQVAFDAAREHLRAGQDFVWNATALTKQTRQKIIGLSRQYDAKIDAVSIDIPVALAKERNRGRAEPLPDAAIDRLAEKREPIMPDEAHALWSADSAMSLSPIFGVTDPKPEAAPNWAG